MHLLSLTRCNDLLAENFQFSPFLATPVSFEAIASGVPCDLWYEIWSKKPRIHGLSDGVNCMILRLSFGVNTTVTNGQTDRRTDGRTESRHVAYSYVAL